MNSFGKLYGIALIQKCIYFHKVRICIDFFRLFGVPLDTLIVDGELPTVLKVRCEYYYVCTTDSWQYSHVCDVCGLFCLFSSILFHVL